MNPGIDKLADLKFFAGLTEESLGAIAKCGVIRTWKSLEYLAHEGEPAHEFYAIESGFVNVEIHRPGRGGHIVQTLHDGDMVGWSWLVPPHRWTFDIKAVSVTKGISFAGDRLLDLFARSPELGYVMVTRLTEVMAQRLQGARFQLLDIYGNDYFYGVNHKQRLDP